MPARREVATRAVVAWSSGKDSALALWRLQQTRDVEVIGLLTTLTRGYDRVSMHAVRKELLDAQAEALGLRTFPVWIPPDASNETYEVEMGRAVEALEAEGVRAVAFGDLFLEDVRTYRERMLAPTRLEPLFPLWGEDTAALSRSLVASGFRAVLTCVDPRALAPEFAGRAYDEALLAGLPDGVDPCGERGEFHTFVHDAPNFSAPINVSIGEVVEREGFVFADVLPARRR